MTDTKELVEQVREALIRWDHLAPAWRCPPQALAALSELEARLEERDYFERRIGDFAKVAEQDRARAEAAERERDEERELKITLRDQFDALWEEKKSAERERDERHRDWSRVNLELIAAEEKIERLLFLAEHLWQMIPQGVWREHGAEWMGQYEGDHQAEQVREELLAVRATLEEK